MSIFLLLLAPALPGAGRSGAGRSGAGRSRRVACRCRARVHRMPRMGACPLQTPARSTGAHPFRTTFTHSGGRRSSDGPGRHRTHSERVDLRRDSRPGPCPAVAANRAGGGPAQRSADARRAPRRCAHQPRPARTADSVHGIGGLGSGRVGSKLDTRPRAQRRQGPPPVRPRNAHSLQRSLGHESAERPPPLAPAGARGRPRRKHVRQPTSGVRDPGCGRPATSCPTCRPGRRSNRVAPRAAPQGAACGDTRHRTRRARAQ